MTRSASVASFPSVWPMWIAVSGRQELYLYFVSKVATAASLKAIFSRAKARAFSRQGISGRDAELSGDRVPHPYRRDGAIIPRYVGPVLRPDGAVCRAHGLDLVVVPRVSGALECRRLVAVGTGRRFAGRTASCFAIDRTLLPRRCSPAWFAIRRLWTRPEDRTRPATTRRCSAPPSPRRRRPLRHRSRRSWPFHPGLRRANSPVRHPASRRQRESRS